MSQPQSTPNPAPDQPLPPPTPSDPLKWQRHRSPHRARSHHQAHAESETDSTPPPPVLEHAMVPGNVPSLLKTSHELQALIDQLRAVGSFAYDSEFIGEHSYFPKLCVIQVATADRVTLIDPLEGLDVTPFWQLVADASVEKIVHAGLQDLEPVVRHLGQQPQNIFDTQIAAAFIGQHYPMALGKLVTGLLNADMGRGLKFSQWDHRPLTPVQLRYAANDVRYLPLLRHVLGERLNSLGNAAWAKEECDSLSEMSLYQNDESPRLRVRGVHSLRSKQLAVAHSLLAWREEKAKQLDLPPRSLLRDDVILELARSPVSSVADLDRVKGLPRPVEKEYGQIIVDMTAAALKGPFPPRPKGFDRSFDPDLHKSRVDELLEAVNKTCVARSVDPAVTVSKKDIAQLVYAAAEGKPVPETRLARGWRRELLAPVLGELLQR